MVYCRASCLLIKREFIVNVKECIESNKVKNTEWYDRIPQRVIVDGICHLLKPLTKLFNLIYNQKTVPDQWLVSEFHKKEQKNKIENYSPISNLCPVSKFFEKLIQKRSGEIEIKNNVDLTGKSQHGFKKKRSTCTAGVTLHSFLSGALDDNNYGIMYSLDFSAAFNVVNLDL